MRTANAITHDVASSLGDFWKWDLPCRSLALTNSLSEHVGTPTEENR
jgi:hypothetical protein